MVSTALRETTPRDSSTYVEMAEIVVENKGRHPITVYQIGFRWKGKRPKWYKRRPTHHTVPRVFKLDGFGDRVYLDVRELRLEPADRMSMLFDYWSILEVDRESPRHRRRIRASAQVAGRARPTLSSRRRQWVIPDSAVSGVAGITRLTVRGLAARAILRATNSSDAHVMSPGYLARLLESHINGTWPDDYAQRHELLRTFFEGKNKVFVGGGEHSLETQFAIEMSLERELTARRDQIDWTDIFIKPKKDEVEPSP
jgi:hypothetical protein